MVSINFKKYNDVINKLQDYIICEKYVKDIKKTMNINKSVVKSALKQINQFSNTTTTTTTMNNSMSKQIKPNNSIYYPKDQDPLYWILYIMINGIMNYEYNKNQRFLLEKDNKIKYIEKIKNHKEIIKRQKLMSLLEFENNLVIEKKISINTFLNLCAIEKKNVLFIKNKVFYELLSTDNEEVYIIYNNKKNNNSNIYDKFGFETCKKEDEKWKIIYSKFIQTNNIMCPIKSISYYKLDDLVQMCNKFGLSIFIDGTTKKKRKSDLYEEIIQYLS